MEAHYGGVDLSGRIEAALRSAGPVDDPLAWSDLAPLDQFHVRGLPATLELAGALDLGPESRVLDVGAGLGGAARCLAATYGCHVTGIDLSEPFVDAAKLLTARCGLSERVAFQVADALALPFDDGAFDVAWTQHVAMNIFDRPRLYGEIARVLRAGGLLAIYDVVEGEGGLIFPVPWAQTSETSHLMSPDAMRALLEASGFSVEIWKDTTAEAIAWFGAAAAAGPRPLGLQVAMGPGFGAMAANLARNLREGRARLVQTILRRV